MSAICVVILADIKLESALIFFFGGFPIRGILFCNEFGWGYPEYPTYLLATRAMVKGISAIFSIITLGVYDS